MNSEQELDEADDQDAKAFEQAWENWQLKDEIAGRVVISQHLHTICALWFGKGNARGCQWSAEMTERVLSR